MAPETRSHGVPQPSRVYHSTPALQQAQFPSRRRTVRTYGKKQADVARELRQQTLTQIDFVSSSAEVPAIELSDDSEEGEFATNSTSANDKENQGPPEEEEDDEEEPVSSGRKRRATTKKSASKSKRRRTLGDETEAQQKTTKKAKESRRRTIGDAPTSSYHTQTLTQFLGSGNEGLIRDSEDEGEDGFDDWLQEPGSPSPRPKQLSAKKNNSKAKSPRKPLESVTEQTASRQSSIVPQTPAKRTIRFEIPSSSQQSTPITARMLDRYGPPDQEHVSPSVKGASQDAEQITELSGKPKAKLVIEDSFKTDSWGSGDPTPQKVKGTPLKDITADVIGITRESSSSLTDLMSTPTRPRKRQESTELGHQREESPTPKKRSKKTPSPEKGKSPKKASGGLYEIPDSDEEYGDFSEEEDEQQLQPLSDQKEKEEERDQQDESEKENAPGEETHLVGEAEPRQGTPERYVEAEEDDDGFVTGAETQSIMDELASTAERLSREPSQRVSSIAQSLRRELSSTSVYQNVSTNPTSHPVPTPQPPTQGTSPKPASQAVADLPPQRPARPLRKPVRNLPPSSQTQPLESQRVPLSTIQSFGAPTSRTDILIPISSPIIGRAVSGHQVHLSVPSKIPDQVVRFWLWDGTLLRYLACVEPSEQEQSPSGSYWRHYVSQMYELNNPQDEEDMREEWLFGNIGKYTYIPPAIVGQFLANLRHALFNAGDEGEEEQESQQPHVDLKHHSNQVPGSSFSISQQVEAQLRSDIASHNTQADDHEHQEQQQHHHHPDDTILVPSTPEEKNKTPRLLIRPSQATTASQVSTPDKQPRCSRPPPPPPPQYHSSSSHLTFPDPDNDSSPPLLLIPNSSSGSPLRASQLLTKSQMLPDSLVRDDARVPPEIWDSDEESR